MPLYRVRIAAVGALVAALLGCESPTEVPPALAVSLTLSDHAITVGESIRIRVVATNTGQSPITVNAHGCPYVFTVRDVRGSTVGPEGRTCDAILILRQLVPGDSIVFEYDWRARTVGREDAAPLLRSGTYFLHGHIGAAGALRRSPEVVLQIRN